MIPIYLPLAIMLIAGFLTPLIGIKLKFLRRVFVTSVLFVCFFFWVSLLPIVFSGETLVYNMNEWVAPMGITLVLDSFSIFFLVLVSGLSIIISTVIEKFIKDRRSEFYSLFLIFVVGVSGVIISGDIFNIFVFTEIMTISLYALTVFKRTEKGLEAGLKYIIVGSFSAALILLGIALVYGITGTLNLADLVTKVSLSSASIPLGLILTGYFTESGVVPFHFWKPDVTEGAPLPVALMLLSISSCTGIYVIIRILFVFGLLGINYLLMIIGILSMVIGAFMALFQEDLKRMLAYSCISQIGYIFFAFGLGYIGFAGGLFQIFNNSLLKMVLLLIICFIYWKQNSLKPVNMPVTGACFLIASMGVAGIPPLNGFASKFLIYEAGFRSGFIIPTLIAIIFSVITLAYYLKAFGKLFSGSEKVMKEEKSFLIPIIVLTIFCIILGIFPNVFIDTIEPVLSSLSSNYEYYCSVFWC